MIPWPFLFCQKPMVSAPVLVLQTVTVWLEFWPVCTIVAPLGGAADEPGAELGAVCEYVNEWLVKGCVVVPVSVPSVDSVPGGHGLLKQPVTVTVWLTFVGFPADPLLNTKEAPPDAELSGVWNLVPSHVAVAVLLAVTL